MVKIRKEKRKIKWYDLDEETGNRAIKNSDGKWEPKEEQKRPKEAWWGMRRLRGS